MNCYFIELDAFWIFSEQFQSFSEHLCNFRAIAVHFQSNFRAFQSIFAISEHFQCIFRAFVHFQSIFSAFSETLLYTEQFCRYFHLMNGYYRAIISVIIIDITRRDGNDDLVSLTLSQAPIKKTPETFHLTIHYFKIQWIQIKAINKCLKWFQNWINSYEINARNQ